MDSFKPCFFPLEMYCFLNDREILTPSLSKCRSESLKQKPLIPGFCLSVMCGSLVLKKIVFILLRFF